MAIFARRQIQKMINSLAPNISHREIRKIVDALNRNNPQSLDAEWELAVLFGLANQGRVGHETDLGGARRADIYFCRGGTTPFEFLADVTCVSDAGLYTQNPSEFLASEFTRLLQLEGISTAGFHIKFESDMCGPNSLDQKVQLRLPNHKRIGEILTAHISQIVRLTHSPGDGKNELRIKERDIDISISYNPRNTFSFGMGYQTFTVPYSLNRNPIYDAVARKSTQLAGTGYSGEMGIFICDGGCEMLRSRGPAPGAYSLVDILNTAISDHPNIGFVVIVWSETASLYLKNFYLNFSILYGKNATPDFKHVMNLAIEDLRARLPKPVRDGRNARARLESSCAATGLSFKGGLQLTGRSVRISSRVIAGLLAGRIDQQRFFEDHGFIPDAAHPAASNPFDHLLKQGRMIEKVDIERMDEDDDDWLTFTFGEPDQAISKFKRQT
jgi:hypothetical protein